MSILHHPRPWLRASLLTVALIALAMLAITARPAAAQDPPPDGCDPNEPVACLTLPDEPVESGAAAPNTPSATTAAPLPRPPIPPCSPSLAAGSPEIASPIVPPPGCDRLSVVATVNRANVLYAQALRSLDTSALPQAWGGEALLQVRGYVAWLRSTGRYATPELRSIQLQSLRTEGSRAFVDTLENWLYIERDRFTGRIVVQENQWVVNYYELRREGRGWLVTRNDVYAVPAPLPPVRPPCIAIFPPPPGCE
jgi:hypothetical protein